jgi:ABC-2 type transport system permease protein
MRKLWFVIKREYVVRVHTRMFLLSTIGLPLLMIGAFVVPAYIAGHHSSHTLQIAILDEEGGMGHLAGQALAKEKLPNDKPEFNIVATIEKPADPARTANDLRGRVESGSLDGYLLIPAGLLNGSDAEFHTRNPGDFTLTSGLARAVTQAAIGHRLALDNVHVSDMNALLQRVKVGVVKISRHGETQERGETLQAAIVLAIILYTSLLMYGITTMRSIIEEKSSRIMEILLSSVRPFQLLSGKILGVGAVGLTQFLIWAVAGALVVAYSTTMAGMLNPGSTGLHLHFPTVLWFWFVVYFLGGYFLYASIYAAIGAAVSSEQDANQVQMPITIVLVLCFTLFPVVVRDPSSHTSILLSMVPFFSPILMVLRVAMETPPLWQVLLSVGILALTILGVIYVSAKIYRVGVLMYGKRPSVVELLRWLRYS